MRKQNRPIPFASAGLSSLLPFPLDSGSNVFNRLRATGSFPARSTRCTPTRANFSSFLFFCSRTLPGTMSGPPEEGDWSKFFSFFPYVPRPVLLFFLFPLFSRSQRLARGFRTSRAGPTRILPLFPFFFHFLKDAAGVPRRFNIGSTQVPTVSPSPPSPFPHSDRRGGPDARVQHGGRTPFFFFFPSPSSTYSRLDAGSQDAAF